MRLLLALVVLAGLTYWAADTYDRFEMGLHLDQHSRDPFKMDADTRKITSLQPEGERAGLVKGATIESLNGAPYDGQAQWAAISNPGKPDKLVFVGFQRPDGSKGSALITLVADEPQPGSLRGLGQTWQQFVLFGLLPLVCMLIGYWVVFAKPTEPKAWLLLMLLIFPEVVFGLGTGLAAGGWLVFRGIYWYSLQILGPLALLPFAIYFPERSRIDVRLPWLKWAVIGPALLCAIVDFRQVYGQFYLAGNSSRLIHIVHWTDRIENSLNLMCDAVRNSYSKVVSLTHPYTGDPTEFPTGTNPYPSLAFNSQAKSATFLPFNQIVAFDPNYRWPYSIQLNFGFQQQFGRGFAVSAYYVGSLNRKSPLYNDINGPQFNITASGTSGASCTDLTKACGYANTSATVNNRRPLNSQFGATAAIPLYSNVFIIRSNQNSNYNGLQVTLQQRLTHRVSAKGYYSWSKTLQSNTLDSTGGLNGTFVDANYPQLEYRQRSDQDRRHMMTMSFVWKPDYFDHYNRLVRTALNGWTVTGIWTANSGQPFTVTTGNDKYFSGVGNNRPSIVPGKTPHTLPQHSRIAEMAQWFDTSAYCRPGADPGCPGVGPLSLLGNTRPAQLDVPGYRNVDASLFRSLDIHESLKFQLRGEVSNVFNLVNLGGPSASINSSTYGQITGSGGGQRIIQVGGRILF